MTNKRYSPTDYLFIFLSWCTWGAGLFVLLMLLVDSDGKSSMEILIWTAAIVAVTWFIAKVFRGMALGDE